MKRFKSNKSSMAFTLVELMMAVSILAIGIVFIVRGLLQNVSALKSGQLRIEAVKFLEARMEAIEESSRLELGVNAGRKEEAVSVGTRKATFIQEISPLEPELLNKELAEVKLMLLWKEGAVQKDATLGSYFEIKRQ